MDIQLKRDVKPHITSDISFDQLVEIAETRYPIAHFTRVYGRQNQNRNALSNTVIPLKTRDTRHYHQAPP